MKKKRRQEMRELGFVMARVYGKYEKAPKIKLDTLLDRVKKPESVEVQKYLLQSPKIENLHRGPIEVIQKATES